MTTGRRFGERTIRRALRRVGVDVVRYPQSDPEWKVAQLLVREGVDLVLDVGANQGQYAQGLRHHGYTRRIVSFEPVREAFDRLSTAAGLDDAWEAVNCALGRETDSVEINVAANEAASSSMLPMLDVHRDAAPEANFVRTEIVQVRSLDEMASEVISTDDASLFLKVDVQGFEEAVFAGAERLLASGRVRGLQMELSFTQLYENGMRWRHGIDIAEGLGMTLTYLLPGFTAPDGRLLQADGVFFQTH